MQSRSTHPAPRVRAGALVLALALLLATPALAAPAATPAGSLVDVFEALWSRLAGALEHLVGANGAGVDPDGAPHANGTTGSGTGSLERVIGTNGAGVDPNGEPQSNSSSSGAPVPPGGTGPGA